MVETIKQPTTNYRTATDARAVVCPEPLTYLQIIERNTGITSGVERTEQLHVPPYNRVLAGTTTTELIQPFLTEKNLANIEGIEISDPIQASNGLVRTVFAEDFRRSHEHDGQLVVRIVRLGYTADANLLRRVREDDRNSDCTGTVPLLTNSVGRPQEDPIVVWPR